MSDAAFSLEHGTEFPYHGRKPKNQAERIALGILADLSDRRGIKWELEKVDEEVRRDIVKALAAIIEEGSELPAQPKAKRKGRG